MTRDDQANAAYGWWKSLGPSKDEQGRTLPGNRAALARLRRCSTVLDVIAEPATGKLWLGRKAAFPAVGRLAPDYYCMDGTIPRARLAEVLAHITALEAEFGLAVANVFHAGDGNLHPLILYDANRPGELERAAALAGVLAHVRESDRRKIATAIGAPPGGDAKEALLKPTRFRTLMAARTGDELLIGFRRAVAILDRKANIRDLSKVIFGWSDDEAGDRVRTRFAFDFYGARDYAPQTSTDTIATPSGKG